jgi:hypothetical protein
MSRDDLFPSIHLVLTHEWFDKTASGEKRVEYRAMTPRWMKRIYNRRDVLCLVTFARGYTKTTRTYSIRDIDIGPCPIPGWAGDYIRIHFTDLPA